MRRTRRANVRVIIATSVTLADSGIAPDAFDFLEDCPVTRLETIQSEAPDFFAPVPPHCQECERRRRSAWTLGHFRSQNRITISGNRTTP